MQRISNTYTDIYTAAYVPSVQVYWRIKESNGMVTAETSDGTSWTPLGPAIPSPIQTTWVQLEIGAGTDTTTSGTAHFDDFNGK
jgi:hypothetical protein